MIVIDLKLYYLLVWTTTFNSFI